MALFIDKYAPTNNETMFFHKKILKQLEIISKTPNLSHVLIYGPPDSGKKTLIQRFLEMLYDKSVNNLYPTEFQIVSTGTSSKTTVVLKQSNHHIVIEPLSNNFDRHILHEVVGSYARNKPLSVFHKERSFKVVLINNADRLSVHAQTSLRRTMEEYSDTCKFILWCTKISSVISPIRSRCNQIRVPSPSDRELFARILYIAYKEKIVLTYNDYNQILKKAKGRIKIAIWKLQFKKFGMNNSLDISFDLIIEKIIDLLFIPDISNVITLRALLYDIFVTNIDGTNFLMSLLEHILDRKNLSEDKQMKIIDAIQTYEHKSLPSSSRRVINHLETCILIIFRIINKEKLDVSMRSKKKYKK